MFLFWVVQPCMVFFLIKLFVSENIIQEQVWGIHKYILKLDDVLRRNNYYEWIFNPIYYTALMKNIIYFIYVWMLQVNVLLYYSYSTYPTFKNAGCFELLYSISVVSSFKKLAQLTSFALTTQQLTNTTNNEWEKSCRVDML